MENIIYFKLDVPELIDLEIIKSNMLKKVQGKKVKTVDVQPSYILRNCMPDQFKKSLFGKKLDDIERKGKVLIFDFKEVKVGIHLMLFGNFCWCSKLGSKKPVFRICFEDSECICVTDRKRWVKVELEDLDSGISSKLIEREMGLDPLSESFELSDLEEIISKKKRSGIKSILMDQKVISGIGNAYSDEILWDAQIHPLIKGGKLIESRRVELLYHSISKVLKEALKTIKSISKGKSISEQSRDFMKVYRKERSPCPRCGIPIVKSYVCGRDTFICGKCQKVQH